ncbi:unnamed protein product, partial [Phaeothamnion confervicola]
MFQLSLSSIRRQLTVLLSVAALFLVLVAGVGAWALMRSASVARQSNDVNMPLQRVGNELIQAVGARAVAARNLVLATDPAVREHELGKVKKGHEATQAAVQELKTLTAGADAKVVRLVDAVVAAEAAYGPVALKITGVAASGDQALASRMIIDQCRPLLESLELAVAALLRHETVQAQQDHEGLLAGTQSSIGWVAALG